MITPNEVKNLMVDETLMKEFENKIDSALTLAASGDSWPCLVSTNGYQAFVQRAITVYGESGWSVTQIDTTENGNCLQFERPA